MLIWIVIFLLYYLFTDFIAVSFIIGIFEKSKLFFVLAILGTIIEVVLTFLDTSNNLAEVMLLSLLVSMSVVFVVNILDKLVYKKT